MRLKLMVHRHLINISCIAQIQSLFGVKYTRLLTNITQNYISYAEYEFVALYRYCNSVES